MDCPLCLSKWNSNDVTVLILHTGQNIGWISIVAQSYSVLTAREGGGDADENPIFAATASVDSIRHSLTKIASGGSQASQEIRKLEQEKRALEEHAAAVQMALLLRKNSDAAAQGLQTKQWMDAATAVRPWLDWKSQQVRAAVIDDVIFNKAST